VTVEETKVEISEYNLYPWYVPVKETHTAFPVFVFAKNSPEIFSLEETGGAWVGLFYFQFSKLEIVRKHLNMWCQLYISWGRGKSGVAALPLTATSLSPS
jgi:hypothetical protein